MRKHTSKLDWSKSWVTVHVVHGAKWSAEGIKLEESLLKTNKQACCGAECGFHRELQLFHIETHQEVQNYLCVC